MNGNSNAQNWKKRKLKFDEYYGRYEIMEDLNTNRCSYIYEQDRMRMKNETFKKYQWVWKRTTSMLARMEQECWTARK